MFLVWVGAGGLGGGGQERLSYCGNAQITGIYSVFCLFVQHTVQGHGARYVVTNIHAFGNHAESTGIYSVFASLHNIL